MTEKVALYGNLAGYIEKRGNRWEGWVEGHDDVTIIEFTKRDCYDQLNSEAWFILNKDSHTDEN